MSEKLNAQFRVHPSVVLQLGEDLITDPIQALLELVKNAYDADSPDANVTINSRSAAAATDSFFPDSKGHIIIEDSGIGMDWPTIQRGWLTISNSLKREMKAQGKLTPKKKRTPLGDKGLGRLGTQLLGQNLEIYTCTDDEDEGYHVGISWSDFRQVDSLDRVNVQVERIPKRKGTKLIISDLRNPDFWHGQQTALQREFSQIFFPFGSDRSFVTRITLNDDRLDLEEAIARIRDTAVFRYKFSFDGNCLTIKGRYRLNYVEGDNETAYQRYIAQDHGASLVAAIHDLLPGSCTYTPEDTGWLLSISKTADFDAKMGGLHFDGSVLANPGAFDGEIDYFDLGQTDIKNVFDSVSQYREFVKTQSGVRVYRDGFAIKPYGFPSGGAYDWLGFSKATSGRSTYFMKVQNTVGFVRISASKNSLLAEVTSREGFQVDSYYRNFMRLLDEVVQYINMVNYQLRKGALDFLTSFEESNEGVHTPEKMRAVAVQARPIGEAVAKLKTTVQQTTQRVEDQTRSAKDTSTAVQTKPDLQVEQETAVSEALATLKQASAFLEQIEAYLARIQSLATDADRVDTELTVLREKVSDFTDLAGLGLTTEAFSHELGNVIDGLHDRTKDFLAHIKTTAVKDPVVQAYGKAVRQTILAMRKQLTHLTPSLRYVREVRDPIDIRSFVEGHISFHENRLSNHDIHYTLTKPEDTFTIRMNRGKLNQVLDNLILNSEYWLQEGLRGGLKIAEIRVTVRPPFIQVSDSGFGIDPAYENILFEPFVTSKPKGKGRGLGLYIVRQLLDAEGCRISLLPQRNEHGRRYIFQIDLSGACSNE